jgi:hypothetical protein
MAAVCTISHQRPEKPGIIPCEFVEKKIKRAQ